MAGGTSMPNGGSSIGWSPSVVVSTFCLPHLSRRRSSLVCKGPAIWEFKKCHIASRWTSSCQRWARRNKILSGRATSATTTRWSSCSQSATSSHGLLQPLDLPSTVWTHLSLDFIEGLPRVNGKSVILTVVDRFSKVPTSFYWCTHTTQQRSLTLSYPVFIP
jgi:hypothetical protein